MRNILLLLFVITFISCENDDATSFVIINGELMNNNSNTVNISGNGFEKEIFISEVYGVTAPIRKTGPGEYTVSVEGNTNRYYYRQGKLVKIVVDNPIKNYQVRLAN